MPLRILHVTAYYEQAWAYGGIPRVVAALARGQALRGHHVTVATTDACEERARLPPPTATRPLGSWPALQADDGVELRVFPNVSNTLAYHLQFFLPLGFDAFMRANAHRFDVAHLHGCHNVPGAIATAHLRRAGVPYVLAPHGTAPRIERRRLAKWIFDHTVGRRVMPEATRLLAVTEAEKAQLVALGVPESTIRVIPHPIDVTQVSAPRRGRFRERFKIPWEQIVLYLGKLTPRKGLDTLVEAFASLGGRSTGLVVAGNDMGLGSNVQRLIDHHGLRSRTLFTGLLRGQERFDALADASVVTYPSQHEIFGLVPIEALLCGTPVIVSDDSGCGEVISKTGGGRVIEHGNHYALASAIRGVLAQPEHWRAQAAEARQHIRDNFDGQAILGRIEELYTEMAAR
jgi:glycosyltransferase involved in cell wall biosynthesis